MTTLTRMALDTSTRFAALSSVTLEDACRKLRDAFDVPPFTIDIEAAGDIEASGDIEAAAEDHWEYATSRGETIAFNLTRIVKFSDPRHWTWMRGAPDDANYQVVISWASEAKNTAAMAADAKSVAAALDCELHPYA